MQLLLFFFYESKVEELRKALTKGKKEGKSTNDSFNAVLLFFYDLEYINFKKKFNQKSGMVPKLTLTPNLNMKIVTKFQVSIFKNN